MRREMVWEDVGKLRSVSLNTVPTEFCELGEAVGGDGTHIEERKN